MTFYLYTTIVHSSRGLWMNHFFIQSAAKIVAYTSSIGEGDDDGAPDCVIAV